MTTGQVFRNTLVILLTLIAGYILIISAHIVLVLLVAIIIASALRPLVMGLANRRLPIGVSITLVYLVFAIVVIVLLVAVLPPVVNQVARYIENEGWLAARIIQAQRWVEGALADVTQNEVSLVAPEEVREAVSEFVRQFRRIMPTILDDIGTAAGQAVLIFVMGAYWLTSHEKATGFIKQLSSPRYRDNVQKVIDEVEATMGGYVRGVALIATIVGLINFGLMGVLNIPNALTVAFIIAITTTIPIVGGLIGVIFAALITLMSAPQYVASVIVIALIVQQIEAYFLAPRIMSDRVGLDPLLIIVYTAIGFVMFGITGALIAVPVMGTVHILLLYMVIKPYQDSLRQFQTEEGLPVIKLGKTHDLPPTPFPQPGTKA